MTIREAHADEAEDVLALWRAAGSPPSISDSLESIRGIMASDHAWLLVAEFDGAIIGSVIASWDGWRGHFYRLAVLPERRRRGIARTLVRAAEERLVAAGAQRLAAIALLDSDEAVGFWTSAGYARQAESGRFVKEP